MNQLANLYWAVFSFKTSLESLWTTLNYWTVEPRIGVDAEAFSRWPIYHCGLTRADVQVSARCVLMARVIYIGAVSFLGMKSWFSRCIIRACSVDLGVVPAVAYLGWELPLQGWVLSPKMLTPDPPASTSKIFRYWSGRTPVWQVMPESNFSA